VIVAVTLRLAVVRQTNYARSEVYQLTVQLLLLLFETLKCMYDVQATTRST
jgi:hypothetical protein